MFRLTIVCFALFLATASATNVKECKNGEPFPLSVDVEGCEEIPCTVLKGSTVVMQVHFVGNRDNTKQISANVYATALGITVPYPLATELADVCSNLLYGANCPIDKTEDVVYNFNFEVDTSYPEISVKVRLNLVDENSDSVACFITDIKVRKSSGTRQLETA
ncbi:PREDICTED: protein NPC2 homolog [Rhagoletis zephyria]|uniref:protein NPC2 homolog n=1 Tax=Rhagoletis zephyria TaxID=28612 RepID=UPI00081138E1|nr:PREDICTED: protein NPC2 homolog [Rhagoletis zephyria]